MAACACSERHQPLRCDLPAGANTRPRQWVVLRRNESRSAFNGYRRAWSPYSYVCCRVCEAYWKTRGDFVSWLPDSSIWPGHAGFKVPPAG